jgi:hypothetical protein
MNSDCVIAVFDEFGAAAKAAEQVRQFIEYPEQVELITRDVEENLPAKTSVPENQNEAEAGLEELEPPIDQHPLSGIGSVLTLMAGKLFTGMIDETAESADEVRTVKDYKKLVANGKKLLAVSGSRLEVEQAAQVIAVEAPVQIDIHYDE